MKILAWVALTLLVINLILQPFVYGKERPPFGTETWVTAILSLGLYVPLLGRVLGWW